MRGRTSRWRRLGPDCSDFSNDLVISLFSGVVGFDRHEVRDFSHAIRAEKASEKDAGVGIVELLLYGVTYWSDFKSAALLCVEN